MMQHDSQEHTPGEMYACPACYSKCHCDELREDELYAYDEDTLCAYCQVADELYRADVAERLGRRAA
jgi:hypothetical protein